MGYIGIFISFIGTLLNTSASVPAREYRISPGHHLGLSLPRLEKSIRKIRTIDYLHDVSLQCGSPKRKKKKKALNKLYGSIEKCTSAHERPALVI